MSVDLESTARDLERDKLVDRGRLKPGGRSEVRAAMERWYKQHKLRAYVLLLPAAERTEETRALWEKLGLSAEQDLLLVSNGHHWEARGWGLSRDEIDRALSGAEPALKAYFGKGIVTALDHLGAAAVSDPSMKTGALPRKDESSSVAPIAVGSIAGAAALGLLGFVIHRRNKRAKEARVEFDAVRASADRAFAQVVLTSEDLSGDDGEKLQLRAGELKKRLDKLVSDADGSADKMSDPTVLGAIRQIESELAALRSTGLQKARVISCSNPGSPSTSPAQRPTEEWDPSNGSDLFSEQSSTSGAVKRS